MVTDGDDSYAVFIYQCGDLGWDGGATIGFGASSEIFANHRLILTQNATSIACLNNPDDLFFTVLYKLSNFVEGKDKECFVVLCCQQKHTLILYDLFKDLVTIYWNL